jgi:hypothetical protein
VTPGACRAPQRWTRFRPDWEPVGDVEGIEPGRRPRNAGRFFGTVRQLGTTMPTMGRFRWIAPVEPWKTASPKEKMPPSEATNQ